MGNWDPKANDIFLEAREIPPGDDRRPFLDEACGNDPELRARVEALLAADARPDAFVDRPAAAPFAETTDLPTRPAEIVGALVAGRYKLLEQIGDGGMGAVWMAEQRQPVKRLVAVKLIKPGMDSKAVLARFEAERQALALMDHPNIARIFDGGTTEAGRPYFVMELVKGIPLTDYCDDRRLTVPGRLDLFVQVCRAVQHAHQKGVIHRDLKPSNILVTEHDGTPVPKVIDFGLAKALHGTGVLTDKTLHTSFGAVVGTPLYMAPEQVGINALDVDTRTDVYALGVLLYELLTGTTPLERRRLQEVVWDEVRRLIREEEPPRPSTRLSSSAATLPSVAARRQVEPGRLSRLVRGELDWIVMKALEKDRGRRYETVNGLARDVQCYLADEPVEARPQSRGYRLRKFVRRNRGPVGATAAVLLAVVAGAGLATWQAVRATRAEAAALAERDDKEKARQAEADQRAAAVAQKERAEKAEDQARQEAAVSRAVRDFLQADLLRQADAVAQAEAQRLTGGGFETKFNPTINELLDRAAAGLAPDKIEAKFPGQPRVQAEILDTIGRTYSGIGENVKAFAHLTRAADLYRATLGPDDPTTLGALHALAQAYLRANRFADAVPLLEKVRDARAARLGPDDPATLSTRAELGRAYALSGKVADSIAELEQVRDTATRTLGPDDPLTSTAQLYLGMSYRAAGRLADAITLVEAAGDRAMKLLVSDHPYAQFGRAYLAHLYREAGRAADALPMLQEVVDVQVARYGPDHPGTLYYLGLLSRTYQDAGRPDQALPLLRQTVDRVRRTKGLTDPATLHTVQHLNICLAQLGRYEEAAAVAREQAAAAREKDGAGSPAYAQALTYLGRVLMWQPGMPEGAEAVAREALAIRRKLGDTASSDYSGDLSNLGLVLLRQGKYTEAEPVLRDCLAIRQMVKPGFWTQFNTASMLGGSLLGQGRYAEAEPLLRAGYEGMKVRETQIAPLDRVRLAEAADRLVQLYEATGKPDEAAKWRAERAKYPPEMAPPPRPAKP